MTFDKFHVRDLSILAQAFSCASCFDDELFEQIASESMKTLDEATPQEITKMVTAFTRCRGASFNKIFPLCVSTARTQVAFMTPKQLALSAGAFADHGGPELAELFSALKEAAIHSKPLFSVEYIAQFSAAIARSRFPFDEATYAAFHGVVSWNE